MTRYLTAYFDTNGCGRLTGADCDFATQKEAQDRIDGILGLQNKEHKVDYRVIPYEPGEKQEVMNELRIFT
jgi:hypothetical protein